MSRSYFIPALLALALVSPVSLGSNAIKEATSFKSEDGNFTAKLKGRIHVDAALYDEEVTSLDDGTDLRRLRIGVLGTVMKDWIYSYNYDSESSVGYRVKDAYIGYKGFQNIKIRVGNLQQPFSLEELTSSNKITFMERSLANVFAPSYTLGAVVNTWGKHWSFAAGYFEDSLGDRHNDNDGGDSVAARVTYNPIDKKRFKIHLGASVILRNLGSGQTVSYSMEPESRTADVSLLSTGRLSDVDDITTYGLEAAVIKGPWLLQAEMMQAELDRTSKKDPTFDGGYIQAGWIVTGERYRYSGKNGAFTQIRPRSRYGAVELAVRYSTLDLEDETVTGGEENNLTLGINWHINRNLRVMANYIAADVSPNRSGVDEDVDIIQFRLQAYL